MKTLLFVLLLVTTTIFTQTHSLAEYYKVYNSYCTITSEWDEAHSYKMTFTVQWDGDLIPHRLLADPDQSTNKAVYYDEYDSFGNYETTFMYVNNSSTWYSYHEQLGKWVKMKLINSYIP